MTKYRVIDTNVLRVADRKNERASPRCIITCIQALQDAKNELVLIDDRDLILSEYRKGIDTRSARQDPGYAFWMWLERNKFTQKHCRQIKITPTDPHGNFEEFPEGENLRGFHRKDKKFVAVALASEMSPTILNASDAGWKKHKDALAANGVDVCNLCDDEEA